MFQDHIRFDNHRLIIISEDTREPMRRAPSAALEHTLGRYQTGVEARLKNSSFKSDKRLQLSVGGASLILGSQATPDQFLVVGVQPW